MNLCSIPHTCRTTLWMFPSRPYSDSLGPDLIAPAISPVLKRTRKDRILSLSTLYSKYGQMPIKKDEIVKIINDFFKKYTTFFL